MTTINAVKKAHEGIERAIAANDWVAADRGIQYFAGAWLRSAPVADGAELQELAAGVNRLRMSVVTDHDIDQTVGPTQVAWMLSGMSSFLSQSATPGILMAHDTAGLIIESLFLANAPMTTSDLATRIGRSKATAARKLPELRAAGLVVSRSAGRNMLNQLTEAGQRLYQTMGAPEKPLWPKSLDKRHTAPEPMIALQEFFLLDRIDAQPNAISSVMALSE